MWLKKQQPAGFEKGLAPFVSKSDTTKLFVQGIYSLALTVQNMNSYDKQHNAVFVAQHDYSLMPGSSKNVHIIGSDFIIPFTVREAPFASSI